MKHETHGTQQPRHINTIGADARTAQRSDSLVSSINKRLPKEDLKKVASDGQARRNQVKKRSLQDVNEHFESDFNTA